MGTDLREQFLSPRRLFEWPATAVGWRSNSSAAVIGLDEEAVQAIWTDASQSDSAVEVANLNSPGQVLSGLVRRTLPQAKIGSFGSFAQLADVRSLFQIAVG